MAAADGQSLASPPPPPFSFNPAVEHWLLCAFADLSTCRSFGMDIGPIPWTAIQAYANEHVRPGLGRRVFHIVMRALDRAYLAEKAAAQPKGAGHV
jgi:hypothetical protein